MPKPKKYSLALQAKQLQAQKAKADASKQTQTQNRAPAKPRPKHQQRPLFPYKPHHHILLVGEGNFSFAHSVARRLGSGSNLTATAFDSEPVVHEKYPDAQAHIDALRQLGARVAFDVDATSLAQAQVLGDKPRFSHIVFNFPHAGAGIKDQARNIACNQTLLMGFFQSAIPFLVVGSARRPEKKRTGNDDDGDEVRKRRKTRGSGDSGEVFEFEGAQATVSYDGALVEDEAAAPAGQIHVTLKSGEPYVHWNVRQLAKDCGLVAHTTVPFDVRAFPGYEHRRTLGFKDGVSKDANQEIRDKDPRIHMFVVRPPELQEKKEGEEEVVVEDGRRTKKTGRPSDGPKRGAKGKRSAGVNSESFDSGLAKAKRKR
ncbi:hypothetical protein LPJ53_002582 [Coemansia erecta]|uniref:25S rRNA (uridine-N(3))-methyltransferase BMT5-like domain-containing protein n=1 Tax=Coemansia erecta TaxID=147472 RepID=A0A9W8CSW5_9FUNG|nr:hypothetical protein LPJ53_002582 [Coemansia erecta]